MVDTKVPTIFYDLLTDSQPLLQKGFLEKAEIERDVRVDGGIGITSAEFILLLLAMLIEILPRGSSTMLFAFMHDEFDQESF